ncbi:MAG: pilus assembly protein PilM [Patescibacteria group bacterium]
MINPAPEIGGLAFSDAGIRFLLMQPGVKKPTTSALRLPPGIIEKGKVKDSAKLVAALKKFRSQIGGGRAMQNIILLLPEEIVYTQPFSMPFLEESKMEESALLNLQMLSPTDFSHVYSGWQKIGERFLGTAQVDLLGAVAEREFVDAYTKTAEEAGFIATAVEFPGLALARSISEGLPKDDPRQSLCIIHVSGEGVLFLIAQKGNLYFSQSHSWLTLREEYGGKDLSQNDFQAFIASEAQKVLNFYQSRWGKPVDSLFVAADEMTGKIIDGLKDTFGVPVEALTLPAFQGIPHAWLPLLGSALRGTMPRNEDSFLSLADHSVRERYEETRVIAFIHAWRSVAVATFAILTLFFGIGDAFIIQKLNDVKKNILDGNPADKAEIVRLQAEAKEFNSFASRIENANNEAVSVSESLNNILTLSQGVALIRVSVEGKDLLINGFTKSEPEVIAFKERLEKSGIFSEVLLPLANIKANPDGTYSFGVSLTAKEDE